MKKIRTLFPLFLLIMTGASAQNSTMDEVKIVNVGERLKTPKKTAKMENDSPISNKEIVRQFYKEVLADWNMGQMNKVVSPKFRSHDWPEDGPTGPQAFRDFYSEIRSAVPDARYEIDDILAEDDMVVVRWRLLGTHKGDFRGIAPTGQDITLNGIAIYRLEDGKIMERWVETDLHRLLGEIQGLSPKHNR